MPQVVHITLKGQPRGKGRPRFRMFWRPGQKSRPVVSTYTDDATEEYEALLSASARDAMGSHPPYAGPCCVEIFAYFAIPKSWPKAKRLAALAGKLRHVSKPDEDNVSKTKDALNSIVWNDDSQCDDVRTRKAYSDKPRLEIFVYPANES